MAQPRQEWFVTFKPRDRWSRFSDRYYVFETTTYDQAQKHCIDIFGRDWMNVVPKSSNPDLSGLTQVDYNEIKKEVERQSRIPFKTFREKEADGGSKTKGN